MERLNVEAIPREHLLQALREKGAVPVHRRIDKCLLCRRPGVNEAALCVGCWSLLGDEEIRQAERWLNGGNP